MENKYALKIAITFILNMDTEEQLIMHLAYVLYIQFSHSCEVSVSCKALLNAEEGTLWARCGPDSGQWQARQWQFTRCLIIPCSLPGLLCSFSPVFTTKGLQVPRFSCAHSFIQNISQRLVLRQELSKALEKHDKQSNPCPWGVQNPANRHGMGDTM